jgi:hypothetical protein
VILEVDPGNIGVFGSPVGQIGLKAGVMVPEGPRAPGSDKLTGTVEFSKMLRGGIKLRGQTRGLLPPDPGMLGDPGPIDHVSVEDHTDRLEALNKLNHRLERGRVRLIGPNMCVAA